MAFLRARWDDLIMINYKVEPELLQPYVPQGTVLDDFHGDYFVSLVAFNFRDTKVLGIKVPFHLHFEEVNLRFYVKHKAEEGWRRGVTFISEVVPKPAIAFVANSIYNENYQTLPMKHSKVISPQEIDIEYAWKKKEWYSAKVKVAFHTESIKDGSEEEFIAEHYFGYTDIGNHKTKEYEVGHPK